MLFSGPQWYDLFPTSRSLWDLEPGFRDCASDFISALRAAGASVAISATYRPPERAYLMHWCCRIEGYQDKEGIFQQADPSEVPPFRGIDIDWTCGGDLTVARINAGAMRKRYGIVCPAALDSRHITRQAIDMTIQWSGSIRIFDKEGVDHPAACQSDLWPIGASYGVLKLTCDAPHWSIDGH